MKKQLFFIAIASLFTSLASAADLYVRDFGAGGAYPTITAAITAAADGDRIIIKPKSGGIPYLENITIDKSLTFVCETNFTKYLLQGTVTITPLAGRVVTINNMNCTADISTTAATTGGRMTVNILNSNMVAVNAGYNNTTLNISGCVLTSYIALTHGKCTANRCDQIFVGTTTLDTNPATDDIEIIANNLPNGSYAVVMNQKNYNFKILNNYIVGVVQITGVKLNGNNEIRNNVINNSSSQNTPTLAFSTPSGNTALISVINNIICSNGSSYNEITNNGNASVYAFYNMSNSAFTVNGLTAASNNATSASLVINNGTYTVTGPNANAGYPDDEYRDLDLSLNDIGNFGGSDSWANYWPTAVGNKPQVNYLNTPRRIYTGTTTLNALGSGYSK